MMLVETKKRARALTLGCWWPSAAYPRRHPAWSEIVNELESLAELALEHRGDAAEAAELREIARALRMGEL